MRLTSLQENLNRGLGIVGRAVATRTTLPITQHVLLSTDESRLKLSATNLEIAISTWIGAQVEEEGAITVPARLLTEFVSSLGHDSVDLQTTAQGKGVELKCARVEARINGADAHDFPPIPSVEQGIGAQVAPKDLRQAIHQVAFAAATEDSRPVLTGVSMELDGDRLTLAAADGFRLSVFHTKLVQPVSRGLLRDHPGQDPSGGRAPAGRTGRGRGADGDAPEESGAVQDEGRGGRLAAYPGHLPQLLPAHPT